MDDSLAELDGNFTFPSIFEIAARLGVVARFVAPSRFTKSHLASRVAIVAFMGEEIVKDFRKEKIPDGPKILMGAILTGIAFQPFSTRNKFIAAAALFGHGAWKTKIQADKDARTEIENAKMRRAADLRLKEVARLRADGKLAPAATRFPPPPQPTAAEILATHRLQDF